MSIVQENLDRLPAREGVRENLHELCSKLVSRVPEIHQIYVFGSQARGDWNEYSDIDLFLTSSHHSAHCASLEGANGGIP